MHAQSLFPAWATLLFRIVLGALLATPGLLLIAFWAWERTPYVSGAFEPKTQPVKFDHRHHVRDDGIDCLYCHRDAERSNYAGVPALSLCMGCHAQIWTDSPELAPLQQAYFHGGALEWRRVTRLPDFVFFDHSVHVKSGVGCVTCHGRVDLMAEVYAVNTFTMQFCLDCHRSFASALRPANEITNMEWAADSTSSLELQRLAANARPSTDCSACHR